MIGTVLFPFSLFSTITKEHGTIGRSIIICRVLLSLCSRLRERTQGPFCTVSHEMVLSKTFTEQQSAFVREIVSGGEVKAAAVKAGYSEEYANSSAYQLLQQPAILAAVQIGVAKALALDSPVARKTLRDIMVDETVDKRLRVACAKDLLNRAGFIAPKAVERTGEAGKGLNEMTMDELRNLADKLEGEIAGRAKPVSSAKAAPQSTQAIDDII